MLCPDFANLCFQACHNVTQLVEVLDPAEKKERVCTSLNLSCFLKKVNVVKINYVNFVQGDLYFSLCLGIEY